jgi:hypothetical protein
MPVCALFRVDTSFPRVVTNGPSSVPPCSLRRVPIACASPCCAHVPLIEMLLCAAGRKGLPCARSKGTLAANRAAWYAPPPSLCPVSYACLQTLPDAISQHPETVRVTGTSPTQFRQHLQMYDQGCVKFQPVQISFSCAGMAADFLSDELARPICNRLQSRA